MSKKRKGSRLTISEKKHVIDRREAGVPTRQVAREMGIYPSSVRYICNEIRDEVIEYIDEGKQNANMTRLILSESDCGSRGQKLFEYFEFNRSKGIDIHDKDLKFVANSIAWSNGDTSFRASDGYIYRWKKRWNVSERKMCGSAADVDMEVVNKFKEDILEVIRNYNARDIFNCYETAFNFKQSYRSTLAHKKEKKVKGHSSSAAKLRATLLLTVSLTGEKLEPLAIWNKVRKPRNYPGKYITNMRAWMTKNIFEEYLLELNDTMIAAERNILLLLDNASVHRTDMQFSNITLNFLPKNTTSETQPLDQGIIRSFKAKYRSLLSDYMQQAVYAAYQRGEHISMQQMLKNISIPMASDLARQAWDKITPETIEKCFKMAGIVKDPTATEQLADDEFLQSIIDQLAAPSDENGDDDEDDNAEYEEHCADMELEPATISPDTFSFFDFLRELVLDDLN
jgi:uncharacterized membrane protein